MLWRTRTKWREPGTGCLSISYTLSTVIRVSASFTTLWATYNNRKHKQSIIQSINIILIFTTFNVYFVVFIDKTVFTD